MDLSGLIKLLDIRCCTSKEKRGATLGFDVFNAGNLDEYDQFQMEGESRVAVSMNSVLLCLLVGEYSNWLNRKLEH